MGRVGRAQHDTSACGLRFVEEGLDSVCVVEIVPWLIQLQV